MSEKKEHYPINLPPNTLTNADGTSYQAGYDAQSDATPGQIAFNTLQNHPVYRRLVQQRAGYQITPMLWDQLPIQEKAVWEDVARAVLGTRG